MHSSFDQVSYETWLLVLFKYAQTNLTLNQFTKPELIIQSLEEATYIGKNPYVSDQIKILAATYATNVEDELRKNMNQPSKI